MKKTGSKKSRDTVPLSKSGLKLVCNVNIVYGNLRSKNSQDYAQKPQRNCTFMNVTSGIDSASLCSLCWNFITIYSG
jgi:hypothetical protein